MTKQASAAAVLRPPHPSLFSESGSLAQNLAEAFLAVRDETERRAAPLSPEDQLIQSMPDASPAKWHRAHTTWFFEQFLLGEHCPAYVPFHPDYAFLYNSYYVSAGPRYARHQRGHITRPGAEEITAYRRHVDASVVKFFQSASEDVLRRVAPLVEVGLNHEQQHQELMLTDIKHAFWMNPLRPAFRTEVPTPQNHMSAPGWLQFEGGLYHIGFEGEGFAFDNETPRHQVFLTAFSLATHLISNREFLAFIEDKGYQRPELWLSLGWTVVNERGWNAPLYWEHLDGSWWMMTLAGMRPIRWDEPVCHLSYFEADAFARWASARLPTEAEWEVAATNTPVEGHFAESGRFHPTAVDGPASDSLSQMFGEVWQWTQSSYAPYPGYQPQPGALGEYNGKFMCNQYVLRGASCATPRSHARRTYRNFFPPDARWQFLGLRVAKDLS